MRGGEGVDGSDGSEEKENDGWLPGVGGRVPCGGGGFLLGGLQMVGERWLKCG